MNSDGVDRVDESLIRTSNEEKSEKEKEEGSKDELTFGTAVIRSTFGLGPGRLNAFTIRKVALGLAQYLNEKFSEPSIVIHFDTRLLSKAFSEEMASVLAENNVTTILSENYKSTPELSFAVRHLITDAGVMITA